MYPENDLEFREAVVTEVGNNSITGEIGTLGISENTPIKPKVGMVARYYGKGFGFSVRGLFVDGVEFWYRTKEEEDQKHKEWCENRIKDKKKRLKKPNRN